LLVRSLGTDSGRSSNASTSSRNGNLAAAAAADDGAAAAEDEGGWGGLLLALAAVPLALVGRGCRAFGRLVVRDRLVDAGEKRGRCCSTDHNHRACLNETRFNH